MVWWVLWWLIRHIYLYISDVMILYILYISRDLDFSCRTDRSGVVRCTMCCLRSMFSFQPNKLRHILKFISWYIIQHIFVPTCLVGRKTWFSNSKFGICGSFRPILSVPKTMFLVLENEYRIKLSSFLLKKFTNITYNFRRIYKGGFHNVSSFRFLFT